MTQTIHHETTQTIHLEGTRGVNPRTREKYRKGKVHRHIGIWQIANPEDKKHKHFGTAKSEIPTGGKFSFGAQLTSGNLGPTQGLILLGKNYEFWSLRMRSFLQAQECWEPVDLGYVEPDPVALSAMTNP
jgi:hypothetical protein